MFWKPLERWGRTLGETFVLITDRCVGGLSRAMNMNGVRKVLTLIIWTFEPQLVIFGDQFHPVKCCQSHIWGSDVCGLIRWGHSCQSGAIQSITPLLNALWRKMVCSSASFGQKLSLRRCCSSKDCKNFLKLISVFPSVRSALPETREIICEE